MSRASVSFASVREEILRDGEVRAEYDSLAPRYEIIAQLIETRKNKNMTQAQLAELVGTQKSNISRLESGNYNPSLDFLIKVAHGLGKTLKVELR